MSGIAQQPCGPSKQVPGTCLFSLCGHRQVGAGRVVGLVANVLLPFCVGQVAGEAGASLREEVLRPPQPHPGRVVIAGGGQTDAMFGLRGLGMTLQNGRLFGRTFDMHRSAMGAVSPPLPG